MLFYFQATLESFLSIFYRFPFRVNGMEEQNGNFSMTYTVHVHVGPIYNVHVHVYTYSCKEPCSRKRSGRGSNLALFPGSSEERTFFLLQTAWEHDCIQVYQLTLFLPDNPESALHKCAGIVLLCQIVEWHEPHIAECTER